jgi:hypothetical protein
LVSEFLTHWATFPELVPGVPGETGVGFGNDVGP